MKTNAANYLKTLPLTAMILLMGCSGGDDPAGVDGVVPATAQTYTYEYSVNSCSTGEHSFNSLQDYCTGLLEEERNNGCALSMRKMAYLNSCGDELPVRFLSLKKQNELFSKAIDANDTNEIQRLINEQAKIQLEEDEGPVFESVTKGKETIAKMLIDEALKRDREDVSYVFGAIVVSSANRNLINYVMTQYSYQPESSNLNLVAGLLRSGDVSLMKWGEDVFGIDFADLNIDTWGRLSPYYFVGSVMHKEVFEYLRNDLKIGVIYDEMGLDHSTNILHRAPYFVSVEVAPLVVQAVVEDLKERGMSLKKYSFRESSIDGTVWDLMRQAVKEGKNEAGVRELHKHLLEAYNAE